jgi:hypothetical protein
MATHIINFPGADIHTSKIKSSSGEFTSDGNLSLLTSGGGTTNLTATSGGNIGINKTVPAFTLDVNGDINFSGDLYQGGSAFVSTPWTIDGNDLEYTSGNIGIGTNAAAATLHISGNTYVSSNLQVGEVANLYVDTETSNVGIGKTDPGFTLDVVGDINFSGKFYEGGVEFVSSPWTIETGPDALSYTAGNVGIGVANPSAKLTVQGGTIINSDQVAKKTYSYTGTITSGTAPAIAFVFSNHAFSAKITAHLIESDIEISTLIIDVTGGRRGGASASTLNIAKGALSIFGDTTSNPWSSTVSTNTTTVTITPSTNLSGTGYYNLFVEYMSADSGGSLTKIQEAGVDEHTFSY